MRPIVMLNGFYKLSASAVLDISMGRCTKVPTRTAEGRALVRAPGTLNPLPKALQMQTAAGRGDAKPLPKALQQYGMQRAVPCTSPGIALNPSPKALHHTISLFIICPDWFYLVLCIKLFNQNSSFMKFSRPTRSYRYTSSHLLAIPVVS